MNSRNTSATGAHLIPISGPVGRRQFIVAGLSAGASLMASAKALAQGAIVPLHCVPPLPPGQAAAFSPASGPVRVRKSVFDLTPAEISRLKNAYAELKKLTQADPRGWHHQGEVHCWYCSGALDSLNGMEIHGGWWFLPWHRAYLYFHERILGALIGDPTFALPYWDWDSCTDDPRDMTGRNRFPGEVYGFQGDTTNPLHDSTRAVGPNDRIPTTLVGPTTVKSILAAKSFTDFGGSGNEELPVVADSPGDPQQMGQLEGAPHGGVHLWTTDPRGFSGLSNMGSLNSAGFDPVFFAHHANIDRLWDLWVQGTAHANPKSNRWNNEQPFFFYDQAGTWTGIVISQMTDPGGPLSYRYDPPNWPAGVAVAATASRTLPRTAQATPLGTPLVELNTEAEAKILPAAPTTLNVALPAQVRARVAETASTGTLVLRIDGVEVPSDRGAVIQVYVNRPDATAAAGPSQGYVGSVVIVPSTAPNSLHLHRSVLRNFGFTLAPELVASLANRENLSVTLVPVLGESAKPAEFARYRRVYIAPR